MTLLKSIKLWNICKRILNNSNLIALFFKALLHGGEKLQNLIIKIKMLIKIRIIIIIIILIIILVIMIIIKIIIIIIEINIVI